MWGLGGCQTIGDACMGKKMPFWFAACKVTVRNCVRTLEEIRISRLLVTLTCLIMKTTSHSSLHKQDTSVVRITYQDVSGGLWFVAILPTMTQMWWQGKFCHISGPFICSCQEKEIPNKSKWRAENSAELKVIFKKQINCSRDFF